MQNYDKALDLVLNTVHPQVQLNALCKMLPDRIMSPPTKVIKLIYLFDLLITLSDCRGSSSVELPEFSTNLPAFQAKGRILDYLHKLLSKEDAELEIKTAEVNNQCFPLLFIYCYLLMFLEIPFTFSNLQLRFFCLVVSHKSQCFTT